MKAVVFASGIISLVVLFGIFSYCGVSYWKEKDMHITRVCLAGAILCMVALLWLLMAVAT